MSEADRRVLPLECVHNFRDFGGYATIGGRRVKRKVLWRSGQHAEASEADLAHIGALGLAAVYDMRSQLERDTFPCRRPAGFAARVVVSDDASMMVDAEDADAQLAPHVAAALAAGKTTLRSESAEAAREGMRNTYRAFPFRRAQVAMMRQIFAGLASHDGPTLVNCMAGKDRTGIAVALVLHALGVHVDDIIADYLLTNTAGESRARVAAGQRFIALVAGEMAPEAIAVVMSAEASWLEAAFASAAQAHGSVDAYLEQVLGADAAMRAAMRARLLEG